MNTTAHTISPTPATSQRGGWREKIYNQLERPTTQWGYGVQAVIIALISISVAQFFVESYWPSVAANYGTWLGILEWTIVGVFTVEYIVRLVVAPNKAKHVQQPLNVVDLLAIAPSYIELAVAAVPALVPLRALRLVRVLRFARLVRVFKLVRYQRLVQRLARYNDTVLQSIMPVIVLMVLLKAGMWTLEYYGIWQPTAELGELFAIIGFALGIWHVTLVNAYSECTEKRAGCAGVSAMV